MNFKNDLADNHLEGSIGEQSQRPDMPAPLFPGTALATDSRLVNRLAVLEVPGPPGDLTATTALKPPAELEATFGAKLGETRASWSAAMKVAHCGLIDDAKALTLADRQINRDLAMADAVKAAPHSRPVVLYAGRAHVRGDRSVGAVLRKAPAPLTSVVTVALQETAVAGVPVDRAAVLAESKGRYDYVWFTGVADKADACDRLRAKGLIPTAGVKAREGAK